MKSVSSVHQKGKAAQLVIREPTPEKKKAVESTNTMLFQPKHPVSKATKSRAVDIVLNGVSTIALRAAEEASTSGLEAPGSAPAVPKGAENRSHNAGRSQRMKPTQVGEEVSRIASLRKMMRLRTETEARKPAAEVLANHEVGTSLILGKSKSICRTLEPPSDIEGGVLRRP